MPELPEVETIINDLKKVLPGLKIRDIWTDNKKMIKHPKSFSSFKKEIIGRKILKIERKGKNIIIHLSDNKTLLIHQKLTGHLLYGKWKVENGKWISTTPGPIRNDPQNRFIHLIFWLSNNKHFNKAQCKQLALSDMRKFAKVLIWPTNKLRGLEDIKNLGPDPMDKNFTFKKFQERLHLRRGKIKQVLMNQDMIAGIGNIYSDEILWQARIHPLKQTQKLKLIELKKIYNSMRKVLKTAINARGSSNVDFRDALGRKGWYQDIRKAYHRTGEKCRKKDGGTIKKIKVGGRSAHFCPVHQNL